MGGLWRGTLPLNHSRAVPRGDPAAEGTPGPSHWHVGSNGLASEQNGAKAGPSGKTLNGATNAATCWFSDQ